MGQRSDTVSPWNHRNFPQQALDTESKPLWANGESDISAYTQELRLRRREKQLRRFSRLQFIAQVGISLMSLCDKKLNWGGGGERSEFTDKDPSEPTCVTTNHVRAVTRFVGRTRLESRCHDLIFRLQSLNPTFPKTLPWFVLKVKSVSVEDVPEILYCFSSTRRWFTRRGLTERITFQEILYCLAREEGSLGTELRNQTLKQTEFLSPVVHCWNSDG